MGDEKIRQTVANALADVEMEEGVRVLLAVESGSRAWGFPSTDSDYDIRFSESGSLAGALRARLPSYLLAVRVRLPLLAHGSGQLP